MKTIPSSLLRCAALSAVLSLAGLLQAQQPQSFTQAALSNSYTAEARRDYVSALKEVNSILQRQPKHYFAQMRAGWLNMRQGTFADALKAYAAAAALEPKAVEPSLGALNAATAMKDPNSVVNWAQEALERDPGNYTALSRLAYAHFQRKEYAEAIIYYAKALDLYPSDTEMKNGLAWSQYYLGEKQKARVLFEEVLEVSPSNMSAQQGRAASAK